MSKVTSVDPHAAKQAKELAAEDPSSGEAAKPMSPDMQDWMRRFQEAGVMMSIDEKDRQAIARRLF